ARCSERVSACTARRRRRPARSGGRNPLTEQLLPEVPGVVTRADIAQTIDAIASVQMPTGNIPWVPGGKTDPWNLVEAAMALDLGSRFTEAERAYEWLTRMQWPEGCWHAYYT